MEFFWIKNGDAKNTRVVFEINNFENCDSLTICAADFFRVFFDGEFVSAGPARTAAGFSRPRTLNVKGVKNIMVEVAAYNVSCYACDMQKGFFGANLSKNGSAIYGTADFTAFKYNTFVQTPTRYSGQRGFVEFTDFSKSGLEKLEMVKVPAPKIIGELEDFADYRKVDFEFKGEKQFFGFYKQGETGFDERMEEVNKLPNSVDIYALRKRFLTGEFTACDYEFSNIQTGFINLSIDAEVDTEIYIVMEEYVSDGNWIFRRSGCNDFIKIIAPKGKWDFLSFEPYAFKFMKVLYKGKAKFAPSLVAYDNARKSKIKVSGDTKFTKIFEAAERSFRQNALDIFMDCPGRERAGWLCDSYFTAKTERLFFGNNDIERAFLENILISKTEELDPKMLPKCFPAQHRKDHYIPNWAMWMVIELKDYLIRTGDRTLIDAAKKRIYDLVSFFDRYVNEFGLLEDLESWVFIEWSICNTPEYICGVNFPSNMLFASVLKTIHELYGDEALLERSKMMMKAVEELSFNGEFFVDNAVRNSEGKLECVKDHTSETCQYYALFFGLNTSEKFKKMMMEDFGPLRKEGAHSEIGRSNMFIGNYLRFLWLCEMGERDRVVDESLEYFYVMAERTGTLWEHNTPHASCDHGFASVAAVILLNCVCGYEGVRDGKPVFIQDYKTQKDYKVKVEFNY
ncbi:MAG: hypothetical protein IJC72_02335 [Clostridia bacterium]|nr:hypothetical protein [Clostridia bacterium]